LLLDLSFFIRVEYILFFQVSPPQYHKITFMDTSTGERPAGQLTVAHTNDASAPFLYMAPLQGVTDALFRNTFHRHFGGLDAAIAPFINPQRHSCFKEKWLADVLPENNPELPIIPQLLHTNAQDFLAVAGKLQDLGYAHINWNLGCPVRMVARKKRGSGLLPYPEMIIAVLEEILPKLTARLSIKTRLGYFSPSEILTLLPQLDAFPLQEIIIHARLGKQLYSGQVNLDTFALCRQHSHHELVYNGDITDISIFQALTERFPWVRRWMIGRGVLADPFLANSLRGNITPSPGRLPRLKEFHADLYQGYRRRFSGPGHLLGRMKQLWLYLITSFPQKQKLLKKITKAQTERDYLQAVEQLWEN
jgi:tRNA-dihydrouridine synthase B